MDAAPVLECLSKIGATTCAVTPRRLQSVKCVNGGAASEMADSGPVVPVGIAVGAASKGMVGSALDRPGAMWGAFVPGPMRPCARAPGPSARRCVVLRVAIAPVRGESSPYIRGRFIRRGVLPTSGAEVDLGSHRALLLPSFSKTKAAGKTMQLEHYGM